MAKKSRMERWEEHSKRVERDAEYQRMVEAAAEGFRQVFRDFEKQPCEITTPFGRVIVLPSEQCDCQCRNSRHRSATLKQVRGIVLGLPSAAASKDCVHRYPYIEPQAHCSSLGQILKHTGACMECSRVALLLRIGLTDEQIVRAVLDRLYPLPSRSSCKKR